MEIEVLENKFGDVSKTKSNRRKKLRAKKLMETNESEIVDQTCGNLEMPETIIDGEVVRDDLEKNIPGTGSSVHPLEECPKTVSGLIESLPEINTETKRKKKRKRIKNLKSKDEILNGDQNTIDVEATGNLAEGIVNGKKRKRKRKKKVAKSKDEIQSTDQTDDMLNLHSSDGQAIECMVIEHECKAQESDFSSSKESSLPDKENLLSLCKDAEPVDLSNAVEVRTRPSLEAMEVKNEVNIECTAQESELSSRKESSLPDLVPFKNNLLDSCKDEETIDLSHADEGSSNRTSSELGEVGSGPTLQPREVVPLEIQHRPNPNPMGGKNKAFKSGINEMNNKVVVHSETCSPQGGTTLSSCDDYVATHLSTPDVKEAEGASNDLCPIIVSPIACVKRKLLVLDVNGLLAHIVMPPPLDFTADAYILGRAIFRRPFCDDFLKFCFKNFDVGIWSSRSKRIIERVVSYLLGDKKDKLKFCWDMDHSTHTGHKTLENNHKPLVCKELSKIWENEDPKLPWKKGDYNESNTLLLDDSPYKALLNPLHTAIFPPSYHYQDKIDNSLGPGGDLRVYLEGLLTSENVQKYVEQHPFGQSAINENNLSWGFYSGVLQTISNRMEHKNTDAIPPLSLL